MVSNEIFETPPLKGREGAGPSSNGLRCRYLCLGNTGVYGVQISSNDKTASDYKAGL